jgi:hypothetical protein
MTEPETDRNEGDNRKMASMTQDAELRSHKRTYESFIKLLAWSTGGVILVLLLMALFLL